MTRDRALEIERILSGEIPWNLEEFLELEDHAWATGDDSETPIR